MAQQPRPPSGALAADSGGPPGGGGGCPAAIAAAATLVAPAGGPVPAPRITVSWLRAGEVVDVFHRYAQDPNGYFMVQTRTSGYIHPSIGTTDGWTSARVNEDWDLGQFEISEYGTWPEIQWTHPTWYNRRGHRLDVRDPSMITQRVLPQQIRQRGEESEAQAQPCLSLFHVRWGGEKPVNPVTEGAGGWGQIGATPSDNYINGLENHVFRALGPTYEIISAFVQSSEELTKISPPLLRHVLRGRNCAALYFLWPICYQDGHAYPAYVDRQKLFQLMVLMEATGIPTRFPHQSHLYRLFASKEWAAQMCLHPLLRVPLTTQVPRQAVAANPARAATAAAAALRRLSETRAAWAARLGRGAPAEAAQVRRGVAKLGWSWEALDVRAWQDHKQLTNALIYLGGQPGSLVDLVFVQEWVDFDVEMRHFVVEPDLGRPETLRPRQIVYTVFKSHDFGAFQDFDRFDRQGCLQACFQDDEAALAHAEKQAAELIVRWLEWLQAQSHELPTVCRFDIMAKRTAPGQASVTTGELTELGGCFLGWPGGPEVVFATMLRSCFRDPPPPPGPPPRPPPPPPPAAEGEETKETEETDCAGGGDGGSQ